MHLRDLPRSAEVQDAAQGDLTAIPPAPAKTYAGTLAAALVLLVTAVLGYRWLVSRPLEIDEYLSYFSDSRPTAAQVVRVQLRYPISLDPPTYHLLSHVMMRWLGVSATALRLPALLGFLLFQATLFLFVRRLAGWRAGIIAMLFPVGTVSFFYAVQGRPYGLLLGAYGLAMLCWQAATRAQRGRRTGWLVGLVFALVLGITSHFFGLLILIPVFAGELVRIALRRKIDWAVVFCIVAGLASVALVLPFQRAAAEYRVHYYNAHVSWHVVPQAYAALYVAHHGLPRPEQYVYLTVLCVASVVVAVACGLRWRRSHRWHHEYAAVAALAILPVFGYLLGVFVTHTADVRYVIATLFAMMAALGIALEPALRRNFIFAAAVILVSVMGWSLTDSFTTGSRHSLAELPNRFVLSPEVSEALREDPSRPIYVQSLADFYENGIYAPDPTLARRFSLVYSQAAELQWLSHDTNFLTARNMSHFAPVSTTPYSELLARGGHPLVLSYPDGWDWLSRDLKARHIPVRLIGKTMGGELEELDLTATPPFEAAGPSVPGR